MRNVGVMAVGLLALIVATACVPISELGETGAVAPAAPQPVATPNSDTPTPRAKSDRRLPRRRKDQPTLLPRRGWGKTWRFWDLGMPLLEMNWAGGW